MAAKKKETNWGILLIVGVAVWMLAGRKPPGNNEAPPGNNEAPPNQGALTPSVTIELPGVVGSPAELGGTVSPGTSVRLQATINNRSTRNGTYVSLPVVVKFRIHEGSFFAGHGTLIRTVSKGVTLPAGGSSAVTSPSYYSIVGTIDRRDVGIDVEYAGEIIASREWDDVYYVKQPTVAPGVEILSIAWM